MTHTEPATKANSPTIRLLNALRGFEQRPEQLLMAQAVEDTIQRGSIALIEAGTGTGKTMAYLIPALLCRKRVIVSTGTKTLQDQIMERDLPMLLDYLPQHVDAVCLKGLSNYVCKRRLHEFLQSDKRALRSYRQLLPGLLEWIETSTSGDRSEYTAIEEDARLWNHVVSGSDTRIGPKCEFYQQCFATHARARAESADVVVVNHHLFFADLALRGPYFQGILPDYDVVIFDEAHQIEDVMTEFFGVRVSSNRFEALARDFERSYRSLHLRASDQGEQYPSKLLDAASRFFQAIPKSRTPSDGSRSMLSSGAFRGDTETASWRLDAALESIEQYCKLNVKEGEQIAQLYRRTTKLRKDLQTVTEGAKSGQIIWSETNGSKIALGASPISVGDLFREHVLFSAESVVLTSATLATNGKFDFIKQRLGFSDEISTEELQLQSPFDYPRQAALFTPRDLPDPRAAGFFEGAAHYIQKLVKLTGGGAFILCTSNRSVKKLYELCHGTIALPSMKQGDKPKAQLLQEFRQRQNAVLFGTSSFWEGVDVPGNALRLVIIDKLPFDVPTDPLVVARCQILEEQGHKPFMDYLVPSAAITLKQGFGRLIRGKDDRGIVAILDTRLTTKGYGKVLMRSLPEATQLTDFSAVQDWWREQKTERN